MSRIYVTLVFLIALSATQGQENPIRDVDKEIEWESEIESWEKEVVKPDLEINSAWLTLVNLADLDIEYLWQHIECEGCVLRPQEIIPGNGSASFLIQSSFINRIAVSDPDSDVIYCRDEKRLLERGDYWLIVSPLDEEDQNGLQCNLVLNNDPPNQDLYVLYAMLVLIGMAVIYTPLKIMHKKGIFDRFRHGYKSHSFKKPDQKYTPEYEMQNSASTLNSTANSSGNINQSPKAVGKIVEKKRERLKSLDTFRGLTLVLMIFVNYGGGQYWYFAHAPWNGLFVADIVFPWFVFIMGISMVFSHGSQIRNGVPAHKVFLRIVYRSIKIFAAGYIMGSRLNNDVRTIRIPGILQRLAMTYLFTGVIHYPFAVLAEKQLFNSCMQKGFCERVHDVTLYWGEWIIMLGVLAAHLCLTYLLPVPGCPTGYVGPGGLHNGGVHYNCTGGAALFIDEKAFSYARLFQWPTPKTMYEGNQPFDPEGLLGTLCSVFHCFLGIQAGKIIIHYINHRERIIRWIIWAFLTGGIGTLLCKASVNNGWIPMNKSLWSVSYMLVTSATAYVMLAVLYVIIDARNWWHGQPFKYPGMNSILIYICHSIFSGFFPVSWQMPDMTEHWQRLLLSIWGCIFWIIVAFILYCKKIFIAF